MRRMDFASRTFVFAVISAVLAGCGSGDDSGAEQSDNASSDRQTSGSPDQSLPPTVSISGSASPEPDPISTSNEPAEGTPQWALRKIIQLRAARFPQTDDLDQLRAARRERNEEIIELATQTISQTHEDPEQEGTFNAAVKQLLEARLQIALQGNREDFELLYADAEQLHARDPSSAAAAEGAFALARFAHTMARRYAGQSPDWINEFSRQARSFASEFPDQAFRAVPLLDAAARSCELNQLNSEAILCYTLLKEKFAETVQGRQAMAVLRRLSIIGKRPEIAGPTLDGGEASIEEYAGKVVLVAFWSTENSGFQQIAPAIIKTVNEQQQHGLEFLGVNLDEEEVDIDAFLETVDLPGRHIFFTRREQRRWENPVVKFYGIRDIPTLWLIDRKGRVVSTTVSAETLDREARNLLAGVRKSASR